MPFSEYKLASLRLLTLLAGIVSQKQKFFCFVLVFLISTEPLLVNLTSVSSLFLPHGGKVTLEGQRAYLVSINNVVFNF